MNSDILLENPKAVIAEPLSRPKTPKTCENAQAVADREARDKLLHDKLILEIEERNARGPKVGHNE